MNYTELVAASKAYADRNDVEVADNIDIFILMAESRINRILKTREQSTRIYTPTIADQEYYTLPPDYVGMRNIQLNDGEPGSTVKVTPMCLLSPEQFDVQKSITYSNTIYYSIINSQIQMYPLQEAGLTIEIVYFQKVPSLTSEFPTNWLADSHPDIYLSGILSQIEAFTKNYDVSKAWDSSMSRGILELETTDVAEKWAGSSMVTRVG
jgi:hypothetical protein